jgi:hypothetical protein
MEIIKFKIQYFFIRYISEEKYMYNLYFCILLIFTQFLLHLYKY